jgi:hypothetical protein
MLSGAAVKDTAAYLETYGRIPDEVWIGSQNLSPADYLATLAEVTERIASGGAIPADVTIRQGHFTADRYVADDSPDLLGLADLSRRLSRAAHRRARESCRRGR